MSDRPSLTEDFPLSVAPILLVGGVFAFVFYFLPAATGPREAVFHVGVIVEAALPPGSTALKDSCAPAENTPKYDNGYGCIFSVPLSIAERREFFAKELPKRGWRSGTLAGVTYPMHRENDLGSGALETLLFCRDSEALAITWLPQVEGSAVLATVRRVVGQDCA